MTNKHSIICLHYFKSLATCRVFGFSFILFSMALLSLFSCTSKNIKENQIPVTKVGNAVLSLSEISKMVPDYIHKDDSITIAKAYINNWIIKQLKLQQAQLNLPIQMKLNIESRVEDYRSTLQIYEYEQQFVREKMDTVVKSEEISDYYSKNPDGFILQKNIITGYYIQVPRNAPDVDDLKRWLKAKSSRFDDEIGKYVATFATSYQSFEKDYIYFDNLLDRIQKDINDQSIFLKANNLIELEDSVSLHFISITNFKLKGTIAPLSLVFNDIRKIILNKRQVALIRRLDQEIFNKAKEEKKFEIYQE